jgi:hypothetical protein
MINAVEVKKNKMILEIRVNGGAIITLTKSPLQVTTNE